jgi:hypothetical protein
VRIGDANGRPLLRCEAAAHQHEQIKRPDMLRAGVQKVPSTLQCLIGLTARLGQKIRPTI